MCYAIPAKIVKIDDNTAIVDYFGEEKKILLDLENVKIGDYIYAQGGISVRKIQEDEAEEILKIWQETFFELKKTDEALAKIDQNNLPKNALHVLQNINLRKTIKKDEITTLLDLNLTEERKVLYEVANNVRQKEHGNASCVHGIIEFSNYCQNGCSYCGLNNQQKVTRYRMSADEIVATAQHAVDEYEFKALVLQSGEDYFYDDAKLIEIVKRVRALGVLVFLSIGSRSKELYEKLYDAGARAALLRFETSNSEIFKQLRPGTTLDDRLDLIKSLTKMGYILATGFMLGLPDETTEDLANNILLTHALQPEMYSFGPFIPTKGTALESHQSSSIEKVLNTIAACRFVAPSGNILLTTAMETLSPTSKRDALLAGANSMMINLTPLSYRKLYNIYDNRAGIDKSIEKSIQETTELLYSLGRAPTDIGLN
ncbi:MAG: [FeFe] hydrogenase H-cluster radical SAM maturase HydE [Gammaproteobacteria bacterium]|nr:[FeFe] hydrogenase H-cluster radical SAM maturase HydE [Gammaproteobacteria bacterium]